MTIDETTVARGRIVGALGQGINPDYYTLTTKDGLAYRYHQTRGLERITDLNGNTVTFTDDAITHSSGESIQLNRDQRGRIKSITDPNGNQIRYQYNLAGDLIAHIDQHGLRTQYGYRTTPAHYFDSATNPLGVQVLKARYDAETNDFIGVFDANGVQVDSREFDLSANTGVIRDANGNATTLIFDDRGNVTEEIDPLGKTTYREYNDPNNPDLETRIIDREGNINDRSYDSRGNILRITERGNQDNPLASPVVTEFSYDSGNRVRSISNASGSTTTFVYDSSGNLTSITNAVGDGSGFVYDSQGRRTTFTDFNGNETTFEYVGNDSQPSRVLFADGTWQQFEYNGFGQVTFEGNYEADGTLAEVKRTVYDNIGRVIEETSGEGDSETRVMRFYDGQLLDWEVIVHPDSLDANGNLIESPATPISQRFSRITDFDYDNRDQLISQTDAEGGIVYFRYDSQGNRVALMDPVGNITSWLYDELNRVIEERDPFYWEDLRAVDAAFAGLSDLEFLNLIAPVNPDDVADPLYDDLSGANADTNTGAEHVRVTAYDGEGNQSKTIDRNGRRREFVYDQAGRLLTELWFAAGTGDLVETISFRYDSLGNMLTATDSNSNYLFDYDELNRLTSVDNNPDGTLDLPRVILSYEYDAQGNVISTSDDSGVTVSSEYNERNLLKWRKWFDADGSGDVDDARVDFTYTASGREKTIHRYSDLTATTLVGQTNRTYDLAGRSDLLIHTNGNNELLAGYDYDYDFAGLLLHEARSHQDSQYAQTIDYSYDLTGQLTSADFDTQNDESFIYDANGNRITSTNGSETANYTTGIANQLTSDGTYRYEYDGEGNQVKRIHLTTGETRTFQYDHRNRLVRVDDWSTDPGDPNNPAPGAILTQSVKYTYDALGRRMSREVDPDGAASQPSEKEFFVYNGDNVWVDFSEAGEAVAGICSVSRLISHSRSIRVTTD
ncbi:MAG: hypothetical protein R3C03_17755 [Pirellulaceae bacterium]